MEHDKTYFLDTLNGTWCYLIVVARKVRVVFVAQGTYN